MIVVDTHVVVWLAFDQARISKQARYAIVRTRENGEGLAISDISLFELARIFSREHTRSAIGVESALAEVDRDLLSCQSAGEFPCEPFLFRRHIRSDSADRIIGGTALVEGIPLITADRAIRNSRALATIW